MVEPIEIENIAHEAMWIAIKLSFPIMLAGMILGLIVSLVQAVTQIHEASLSFIPKMLAIFISIILMMPRIASTLSSLAIKIFDAIGHP